MLFIFCDITCRSTRDFSRPTFVYKPGRNIIPALSLKILNLAMVQTQSFSVYGDWHGIVVSVVSV